MRSLENDLFHLTGASAIIRIETVQTLWSGYGELKRYFLKGGKYPSVIVKHIQWPKENDHPRGWNTNLSHQRKLRSYQVEKNWYQHDAGRTHPSCKVPQVLEVREQDDEMLLIMEDLDASGFHMRLTPGHVNLNQARNVLSWLANFHAVFLGSSPEGLWPTGTYWHLDTRPDEWEQMQNLSLKAAARAIDERLNASEFQTLVHGDAKLANFCFSESNEVAAVDFQYVGKGCGMKDVAYFISSCWEEEGCERYEGELLDHYFGELRSAMDPTEDGKRLEEEWRALYAYAWADFYRFLDGWSPGHWKMHGYSERLTQRVLAELK